MKKLMWIIWPSFLMAGLIEMLVFAVVDPSELALLGRLDWSRSGIYTVAFFVLWAVVGLSSALTLFLADPEPSAADTADRRESPTRKLPIRS